MEKLLQYAWKCRLFPLTPLVTTDGLPVEVLDPGLHNRDAGPDFFNAKVRIGDTVWAGNVEMHLRSSDWFRHGHQADAAYDSVILHVTCDADVPVTTLSGKQPPQLVMTIPEDLKTNYQQLLTTADYPRCHSIIPDISSFTTHSWMDALLCERLEERSKRVLDRLAFTGNDWERTFFISLARSFGFSLNGEAFERWARLFPLSAAGKHRDSLFQLQALFLGTAGLLDRNGDEKLKNEYNYLAHKFQISETLAEVDWRYLRTRPQNFPHVRLLELAQLYHQSTATLSQLLESSASIDEMTKCLQVKGLSKSSISLIIINTIVPVLYAYGTSHREELYQQRALQLLEQLPAENNRVLRLWAELGIHVETAADSQALLQLKLQYCDRHDCLRCRFGFEYLKRK